MASKLKSQGSAYHSITVVNRPSNDLSDEYSSLRLSYNNPPKSELNYSGGQLGEMNSPTKTESLDNSHTPTFVLCQLLQQKAAPKVVI